MKFTLAEIQAAAATVYQHMPPTAQIIWPQLCHMVDDRDTTTIVVKHENHTPTGSFKLRGAITFLDYIVQESNSNHHHHRLHHHGQHPKRPKITGICTATRGNHGQGLARMATYHGLTSHIYVPFGNASEKNAAMRAFGATVTEWGNDYDAARLEALRVVATSTAVTATNKDERHSCPNLVYVPPFHRELVRGVATYAYELFSFHPDLDTVYVPIGGGTGICGTILVRNLLQLPTKIVAVVSDQAPCARWSVEAGRIIETTVPPRTIADGIAVRVPIPEAFAIYSQGFNSGRGVDRFVTVTDEEIAAAMRLYFSCTHNIAEGAGAAPLAALLQETKAAIATPAATTAQGKIGMDRKLPKKKVGVILCGGNVDTDWYRSILSGTLPSLLPGPGA